MNEKERKILLQDLCVRLPYEVKIKVLKDFEYFDDNLSTEHIYQFKKSDIDEYNILPYLHPLSSMTEEEAEQIIKFIRKDSIGINKIDVRQDHISAKVDYLIGDPETITVWFDDIIQSIEIFDFLNAHHFDYRGLIPMGLAIDAHEGMYNKKQNTMKHINLEQYLKDKTKKIVTRE